MAKDNKETAVQNPAQNSVQSLDSYSYDLGKLYANIGSFALAVENFHAVAQEALVKKDYSTYLDCQYRLLRIFAERMDQESIHSTKEQLQDLVLKEGVELNPKIYYVLGICSYYKSQFDVALDYFQKALAMALTQDNKEDMSHAIYGIASTYLVLGRLTDALKEIYNLEVFFEVLKQPDLQYSTKFLNGMVLAKLERYDQALEVYWSCYEDLKEKKSIYWMAHCLFRLGVTYKYKGDTEFARIYLQLAKKTMDPVEMKQLLTLCDEHLNELGVNTGQDYDLVLDSKTNTVTERKKGKVDFKSQFILLDLLNLFAKNPGTVFSKDLLASKIWGQSYDPSVHDNKIYVTIKRLREMIEPDAEKPRYIFRAKNGYFLNKMARVLVD